MPIRNLPYQLGNTYPIATNVVAKTRTVFSKRMQGMSQRILANALRIARDSLVYTIGRIEANTPICDEGNPPQHDMDMNFVNAFLGIFNVEFLTVAQYRGFLLLFKITCVRILHGFSIPMKLVDVNLNSQGSNMLGYVNTHRNCINHRHGQIHIDFDRIQSCDEWRIANILVHEASHKFADTHDFAYIFENEKCASLKPQQLLCNADSIAKMVINSYKFYWR